MESDFVALAAGLIELLKQHEIERSLELLRRAEREAADASLRGRQEAVHATSLAIVAARRQRDAVVAAIRNLPPGDRLEAEHRMMPTLDRLFDAEITRLRGVKRAFSKP